MTRKPGTFGFLGNIPAEKLASLPAAECSKKLMGGKKEKYKRFIKNLLFMKAKGGAGRNAGVRVAATPSQGTGQPSSSLTFHPRPGSSPSPSPAAPRVPAAASQGRGCRRTPAPQPAQGDGRSCCLCNPPFPQTLPSCCTSHWNNGA